MQPAHANGEARSEGTARDARVWTNGCRMSHTREPMPAARMAEHTR